MFEIPIGTLIFVAFIITCLHYAKQELRKLVGRIEAHGKEIERLERILERVGDNVEIYGLELNEREKEIEMMKGR